MSSFTANSYGVEPSGPKPRRLTPGRVGIYAFLIVAAIFFHDFGWAGAAVGPATDAARATAADGFDGWNSQVSNSAASGCPDTSSAYRRKSATDALP